MSNPKTERGEVRCLLCGRYLADINRTGAALRLVRAPHGSSVHDSIRLTAGRLHCVRCGGRAFVEWDLMVGVSRVAGAA